MWLLLGCIENTVGKHQDTDAGIAAILVEPRLLAFGDADPGAVLTDAFTISSVGDVAVDVSSIELSSAAFSLLTLDGAGLLAPGDSVEVLVSYTPVNPADSAWVIVHNDDVLDPKARVELTGGSQLPALALDPPSLDFGNVEEGVSAMLPLSMTNVGDAALTIDTAVLTGASFTALAHDTLPLVLAPGASSDVDIHFTPTASGRFDGTLWVGSDAPSGVLSAPVTGTSGVPVAVCDANPTEVFAHQETADFYGHDSYDLGGGSIVEWDWTLLTRPAGSTASLLSTGDADVSGFAPDLAGIYEAVLVVQDDDGLRSEPCVARLEAIPAQDMWIEMYWTHAGDDMDLHLLEPGGALNADSDCFFANCVGVGLDWGVHGDDLDDPALDIDDIPGLGPENINIDQPESGVFTVYVHDYPGSVYTGANDVTVRIYLAGLLAWEDTRTISGEDDFVPFAEIDWPAATVADR